MSTRRPQSILVPILDQDITDPVFGCARRILADTDARLMLLHLGSAPVTADAAKPGKPSDDERPRWRQLAEAAGPERVFVDAVLGDPARVVVAQAERFGSDLIVLGRPAATADRACIDRVIAQVRHNARTQVLVPFEPPLRRPIAADRSIPRDGNRSRLQERHGEPDCTSPAAPEPHPSLARL